MDKAPEPPDLATLLGTVAMCASFIGNRRRERERGDERNRTTAEGNKKRNRSKKNKQAKNSRKQNR
jgi:hypothetical protein